MKMVLQVLERMVTKPATQVSDVAALAAALAVAAQAGAVAEAAETAAAVLTPLEKVVVVGPSKLRSSWRTAS